MKYLIAFMLTMAMVTGCSTTKPRQKQVHEQAIGGVVVTYDNDDWIRITSTGTAPLYGSSPQVAAEASKIAAMHAKANIAEFIGDRISLNKEVKADSKSGIKKGEDDSIDIEVSSEVIENLRSDAHALLRGIQITHQSVSDENASVEVTVTKQSISAARSVQSLMSDAD